MNSIQKIIPNVKLFNVVDVERHISFSKVTLKNKFEQVIVEIQDKELSLINGDDIVICYVTDDITKDKKVLIYKTKKMNYPRVTEILKKEKLLFRDKKIQRFCFNVDFKKINFGYRILEFLWGKKFLISSLILFLSWAFYLRNYKQGNDSLYFVIAVLTFVGIYTFMGSLGMIPEKSEIEIELEKSYEDYIIEYQKEIKKILDELVE